MGTILVAALLSLVFVYAIYSYVRKLRQGGGCCGGHEPAEKKVKVADRDKRHYPYTVTLTVDGMTCGMHMISSWKGKPMKHSKQEKQQMCGWKMH